MKELISLYDNFLIYHPNYFFSALFLLGFLVILILISSIGSLKIKQRTNKFRKARIKLSPIKINLTNVLTILAITVSVVFRKIYKSIEHVELKTERILKKIQKAVLIED